MVMATATPLTEIEKDKLTDANGFPDWDYMPGEDSEPFEYKASDWGWFDGFSSRSTIPHRHLTPPRNTQHWRRRPTPFSPLIVGMIPKLGRTNELHRPPHHHVHGADRGARGHLEVARAMIY
jgi:hypothetical protein